MKTNGTGFILSVESPIGSGLYVQIAHLTTNGADEAHALVDVSNKTDGHWRCILPEGQKTIDLSGEVIMSDDASIKLTKTIMRAGELRTWRMEDSSGAYRDVPAYVENFNETGEINGTHTGSLSIQSNGTPTFNDT